MGASCAPADAECSNRPITTCLALQVHYCAWDNACTYDNRSEVLLALQMSLGPSSPGPGRHLAEGGLVAFNGTADYSAALCAPQYTGTRATTRSFRMPFCSRLHMIVESCQGRHRSKALNIARLRWKHASLSPPLLLTRAGNLCGQCRHGYGRTDFGSCIKCPSLGVNHLLYILKIGVTVLMIFVSVYSIQTDIRDVKVMWTLLQLSRELQKDSGDGLGGVKAPGSDFDQLSNHTYTEREPQDGGGPDGGHGRRTMSGASGPADALTVVMSSGSLIRQGSFPNTVSMTPENSGPQALLPSQELTERQSSFVGGLPSGYSARGLTTDSDISTTMGLGPGPSAVVAAAAVAAASAAAAQPLQRSAGPSRPPRPSPVLLPPSEQKQQQPADGIAGATTGDGSSLSASERPGTAAQDTVDASFDADATNAAPVNRVGGVGSNGGDGASAGAGNDAGKADGATLSSRAVSPSLLRFLRTPDDAQALDAVVTTGQDNTPQPGSEPDSPNLDRGLSLSHYTAGQRPSAPWLTDSLDMRSVCSLASAFPIYPPSNSGDVPGFARHSHSPDMGAEERSAAAAAAASLAFSLPWRYPSSAGSRRDAAHDTAPRLILAPLRVPGGTGPGGAAMLHAADGSRGRRALLRFASGSQRSAAHRTPPTVGDSPSLSPQMGPGKYPERPGGHVPPSTWAAGLSKGYPHGAVLQGPQGQRSLLRFASGSRRMPPGAPMELAASSQRSSAAATPNAATAGQAYQYTTGRSPGDGSAGSAAPLVHRSANSGQLGARSFMRFPSGSRRQPSASPPRPPSAGTTGEMVAAGYSSARTSSAGTPTADAEAAAAAAAAWRCTRFAHGSRSLHRMASGGPRAPPDQLDSSHLPSSGQSSIAGAPSTAAEAENRYAMRVSTGGGLGMGMGMASSRSLQRSTSAPRWAMAVGGSGEFGKMVSGPLNAHMVTRADQPGAGHHTAGAVGPAAGGGREPATSSLGARALLRFASGSRRSAADGGAPAAFESPALGAASRPSSSGRLPQAPLDPAKAPATVYRARALLRFASGSRQMPVDSDEDEEGLGPWAQENEPAQRHAQDLGLVDGGAAASRHLGRAVGNRSLLRFASGSRRSPLLEEGAPGEDALGSGYLWPVQERAADQDGPMAGDSRGPSSGRSVHGVGTRSLRKSTSGSRRAVSEEAIVGPEAYGGQRTLDGPGSRSRRRGRIIAEEGLLWPVREWVGESEASDVSDTQGHAQDAARDSSLLGPGSRSLRRSASGGLASSDQSPDAAAMAMAPPPDPYLSRRGALHLSRSWMGMDDDRLGLWPVPERAEEEGYGEEGSPGSSVAPVAGRTLQGAMGSRSLAHSSTGGSHRRRADAGADALGGEAQLTRRDTLGSGRSRGTGAVIAEDGLLWPVREWVDSDAAGSEVDGAPRGSDAASTARSLAGSFGSRSLLRSSRNESRRREAAAAAAVAAVDGAEEAGLSTAPSLARRDAYGSGRSRRGSPSVADDGLLWPVQERREEAGVSQSGEQGRGTGSADRQPLGRASSLRRTGASDSEGSTAAPSGRSLAGGFSSRSLLRSSKNASRQREAAAAAALAAIEAEEAAAAAAAATAAFLARRESHGSMGSRRSASVLGDEGTLWPVREWVEEGEAEGGEGAVQPETVDQATPVGAPPGSRDTEEPGQGSPMAGGAPPAARGFGGGLGGRSLLRTTVARRGLQGPSDSAADQKAEAAALVSLSQSSPAAGKLRSTGSRRRGNIIAEEGLLWPVREWVEGSDTGSDGPAGPLSSMHTRQQLQQQPSPRLGSPSDSGEPAGPTSFRVARPIRTVQSAARLLSTDSESDAGTGVGLLTGTHSGVLHGGASPRQSEGNGVHLRGPTRLGSAQVVSPHGPGRGAGAPGSGGVRQAASLMSAGAGAAATAAGSAAGAGRSLVALASASAPGSRKSSQAGVRPGALCMGPSSIRTVLQGHN